MLWWMLCIAGGILGEIFDALPSEGGYSGGGQTRNSYYEPSHSTYVQHNSTVTPSPPAPYQPYTPSPQRDYQKEWYNNGGGAWQQNIQQQQRRDAGQQW